MPNTQNAYCTVCVVRKGKKAFLQKILLKQAMVTILEYMYYYSLGVWCSTCNEPKIQSPGTLILGPLLIICNNCPCPLLKILNLKSTRAFGSWLLAT